MYGSFGESNRNEGPAGVVVENMEDKRGRMKRINRGKRFERADAVVLGGSSEAAYAYRGLRLGRPPPI